MLQTLYNDPRTRPLFQNSTAQLFQPQQPATTSLPQAVDNGQIDQELTYALNLNDPTQQTAFDAFVQAVQQQEAASGQQVVRTMNDWAHAYIIAREKYNKHLEHVKRLNPMEADARTFEQELAFGVQHNAPGYVTAVVNSALRYKRGGKIKSCR